MVHLAVSRQSQIVKDFVHESFSLQNYMDLSKGHIRALQEGDLSSPKGIEACINASEALLQCMNVALRPGVCLKHPQNNTTKTNTHIKQREKNQIL